MVWLGTDTVPDMRKDPCDGRVHPVASYSRECKGQVKGQVPGSK